MIDFKWYNNPRTTELGWSASSRKEVMPMSFSFHELILFGMFILALLTYMKRK